MKLILFLFGLLISTICFSQNKLALIVGIGEYSPDSKLPKIAAVNDIKYIKTILNKNGFSDGNIQLLINAKATKANILKSLSDIATKAKANDVILLHFGCHGQQIRDQKTVALGKDEDDGYDESLLPYDAKAGYNPTGYKGENHLRDDDLYPKLLAIRQKIGKGGSLLVLLDACNSGTGTRSESFAGARGEPIPFPDPENPLDSLTDLSVVDTKQGFFDKIDDSIANMVVISGSGPHQINKQVLINNEELGALSYAFYKAMSNMPAGSDYRLLFEKIKATIQSFIPDQLPMIEGNADQIIFSGKYAAQTDKIFLRVGLKNTMSVEDTVFTIEKGRLDNIGINSVGAIYEAGNNQKIADGKIKKVDNFISIGVASKPLKRNQSYEIRQLEENYGNLSASIKVKYEIPLSQSSALEQQVKALLKPYNFLSLGENADFQIDVKQVEKNKKAVLSDRNDKELWTGDLTSDNSLSATDGQLLVSEIKKSMRIKYLRTMPDGGDLASFVSVEIIPDKPASTSDGIVLEAGDGYALKINNQSDKKLFYTVLDIYPDNHVEVLYPYKGKEAADYSIEKNAVIMRKLSVSKGSPAGAEFLKVIFSPEPMDLRSVFAQTIKRDAMQSLQVMIDDIFNDKNQGKTTRGDVTGLKVEDIGIVTVHFNIKLK